MLPKLDVPTYEVNLISTGKPVRFRPFLVKEQKLFLMASESEDPKETINVVRQVLKNCIIDELDIDALPTFDLEWLFIHLRARSVEEVVHLSYKCNNTVKNEEGEDEKCIGVVEIVTMSAALYLNNYDKDQMYHGKDTDRKELVEFIDNLQQKDLEKFKQFFDTVPEVKKDVSFECPKCKYKEDIAIKGIQSFFV